MSRSVPRRERSPYQKELLLASLIKDNDEAWERLDALYTNLEKVLPEIATVMRMLKLSNKYLKGFNYVK